MKQVRRPSSAVWAVFLSDNLSARLASVLLCANLAQIENMENLMIDLHCHSTASDGTDSPSRIIEKAHEIGLTAIALTDHDVVDGLAEFQAAAAKYPGLWAVNGTELAVDCPGASVEILALDIKDVNPFRERQKKLIAFRNQALVERIDKLNGLGIEITAEDVYLKPDGSCRSVVGRPHIAAVLLEKGYVATIQEAFDRYLKRGAAAYVPKRNPPLRETIEFIRSHNAVASLAHPIHTRLDDESLFNLLKKMKDYGLQAMECYHSDQPPADTRKYLQMAGRLGLFATGGSDYHGAVHPDIELGRGKGRLNMPDSLLQPFIERKKL